MAGKTQKNKKQDKSVEKMNANRQRTAQIFFAAFAIILILSMVLAAVKTY